MIAAFSDAAGLPVNAAQPVITFSPVTLSVPGRPVPLEVKVSAPVTGATLPIIVLSHGHGMSNFLSSLKGYGPVVDFWAAHGFVVLQPTHLDFTGLGLRETDATGAPLFWRSRVQDMRSVLDHLDTIEKTVPGLAGRLDRTKIAAVGHSLGGHTVSMLCGMTVTGPEDGTTLDLRDDRVVAGVVMAGPAAERYPDLAATSFSTMTGQALIVVGEDDHNPMFTNRPDWRSDAYHRSPGANKTLLTLFAAEHMLGGISGYDAGETTDENPERVAALRALVWAYLQSALNPGDPAWTDAAAALAAQAEPWGRVDTKKQPSPAS